MYLLYQLDFDSLFFIAFVYLKKYYKIKALSN